MNTGSSTLKVTVNGKKYLITGIERETSCKGLLCAIAKVTSQEETTIQKYGLPNENLLERFKGDRKLAGDLTSLNVFNSLAKDAKIIAKETVTVHKELIIDDSPLQVQHSSSKQHHKNSKKQKHSKESKKEKDSSATTKKEKESKESKKGKELKKDKHKDSKKEKDRDKEEKKSKHKHRNKKEIFALTTTKTTETTKVKNKVKHRSVDDSDIETYKRDSLKRLQKNKRRVYDDSDIEVYKTLQSIVVDQSKKLSRIQLHTREVKRTAWMKELKRNSQIYYLDDRPSTTLPNDSTEMVENAACAFEKDDGNDSGLPSPEYDSSESHENQPIKIKEASTLLSDNNNNNTKYQIGSSTKTKSKHSIVSNKNNKEIKQLQDDTLPNQPSTKTLNNENCSNSTSESISVISANRLNNETLEKSNGEGIQEESEKHDNEISSQYDNEGGSLPAFVELEKTNTDISGCHTFTDSAVIRPDTNRTSPVEDQQDFKNMMIDKNKNILKDSSACEKEVSRMVAFNEALFKASTTTTATTSNGVSKKSEKKKFKKSDISQPVLLSPSTLKKHHNVKKVQSVLGKQAADVLRQDVVKSLNGVSTQTAPTKEVTKEKEKYFNKKLKEIRSKTSKKLKTPPTSSRGEDPEYFSKKQSTQDSSSTTKSLSTNNPEKSTTKTTSTNSVTVANHKSLNHDNSISKLINDPHKSNDLEVDVRMKSSTTSDENESPRKTLLPKCKQNGDSVDACDKSGDLTEETALKADEILNEILEYERNIKNELDQIIQSDDNEKKNTNKSEEEEEVKEKGAKSEAKIVNELSTKKTNEQKQIKNIPTITNLVRSEQSNNNIAPTVNESSTTTTQDDSLSNGLDVVKGENPSTMRRDEEQERFDLIEKYLEEKQALEDISEKLSEYNYALSRLKEEISMFDLEQSEPKTFDELDKEEQNVYKEIANVRGLLKSVADLTSYQRKEMTENMETIDQIDLEHRTLKANFENLRSGNWRTNSKSAPRSLIKNAKVKRRNSNKQGFV